MKTKHIQEMRRLEHRWRKRAMGCWSPDRCGINHGLAAVQFIDNSRLDAPYVELHSLMVLAMYADHSVVDDSPSDYSALRVGGYRASRVPHGVQWGGVANAVLFKDFRLMPGCGARQQRLDCRKLDLLRRAITLSDLLVFGIQQPRLVRRNIELPMLWAAFRAGVAKKLVGSGPEFEQACNKVSANPQEVLHGACRRFDGLHLYPHDWFDSELEEATTVFAEIAGFPITQVFRCKTPSRDLTGYNGASEFDFYHSGFRRQRRTRS